jgi:hypothetical protein
MKSAHAALAGGAYRKFGYITTFFVGRCRKFHDSLPKPFKGCTERAASFPHLPAKSAVRYGAPELVAGQNEGYLLQ